MDHSTSVASPTNTVGQHVCSLSLVLCSLPPNATTYQYTLIASGFIALFVLQSAGWMTLSRQFGRKSRITHCPARLEASGVHVGQHGTIQIENAARQKAYDEMHESLHKKGLQLGNTITQGLSMDDLFQVRCCSLFLLGGTPRDHTSAL